MERLIISEAIQRKLDERHGGITRREIQQCFENCEGEHLIDDREQNRTNPPTQWFIALTNQNRLLKVVFVFEDGKVFLKTAYEPSDIEIRLYKQKACC